MDEFFEIIRALTWQKIMHNHQDILRHDTCPLCMMEQALYKGK